MSIVSDVRSAVAAKLRTLLPNETITEQWVPTVEREDMSRREICVVAESRETSLVSRGCKQTKIMITVGIVELFSQGSESSAADACSVVIDTIIEGMLGKRAGDALCLEAKQPLFISPELWRDNRQFVSLVTLMLVVS